MKCSNCPFHDSGHMYNCCSLRGWEYYQEYYEEECKIVNDDGTVNAEQLKEERGFGAVQTSLEDEKVDKVICEKCKKEVKKDETHPGDRRLCFDCGVKAEYSKYERDGRFW